MCSTFYVNRINMVHLSGYFRVKVKLGYDKVNMTDIKDQVTSRRKLPLLTYHIRCSHSILIM
ncbi:hypothetical protein MHBO_005199 [Bonamia ostreae]|uniref:Uncharacterized protein n=1 Tax=Bonamia ostreae TaxID=126728 RepID=A0ABV2AVA1_9EUKA